MSDLNSYLFKDISLRWEDYIHQQHRQDLAHREFGQQSQRLAHLNHTLNIDLVSLDLRRDLFSPEHIYQIAFLTRRVLHTTGDSAILGNVQSELSSTLEFFPGMPVLGAIGNGQFYSAPILATPLDLLQGTTFGQNRHGEEKNLAVITTNTNAGSVSQDGPEDNDITRPEDNFEDVSLASFFNAFHEEVKEPPERLYFLGEDEDYVNPNDGFDFARFPEHRIVLSMQPKELISSTRNTTFSSEYYPDTTSDAHVNAAVISDTIPSFLTQWTRESVRLSPFWNHHDQKHGTNISHYFDNTDETLLATPKARLEYVEAIDIPTFSKKDLRSVRSLNDILLRYKFTSPSVDYIDGGSPSENEDKDSQTETKHVPVHSFCLETKFNNNRDKKSTEDEDYRVGKVFSIPAVWSDLWILDEHSSSLTSSFTPGDAFFREIFLVDSDNFSSSRSFMDEPDLTLLRAFFTDSIDTAIVNTFSNSSFHSTKNSSDLPLSLNLVSALAFSRSFIGAHPTPQHFFPMKATEDVSQESLSYSSVLGLCFSIHREKKLIRFQSTVAGSSVPLRLDDEVYRFFWKQPHFQAIFPIIEKELEAIQKSEQWVELNETNLTDTAQLNDPPSVPWLYSFLPQAIFLSPLFHHRRSFFSHPLSHFSALNTRSSARLKENNVRLLKESVEAARVSKPSSLSNRLLKTGAEDMPGRHNQHELKTKKQSLSRDFFWALGENAIPIVAQRPPLVVFSTPKIASKENENDNISGFGYDYTNQYPMLARSSSVSTVNLTSGKQEQRICGNFNAGPDRFVDSEGNSCSQSQRTLRMYIFIDLMIIFNNTTFFLNTSI